MVRREKRKQQHCFLHTVKGVLGWHDRSSVRFLAAMREWACQQAPSPARERGRRERARWLSAFLPASRAMCVSWCAYVGASFFLRRCVGCGVGLRRTSFLRRARAIRPRSPTRSLRRALPEPGGAHTRSPCGARIARLREGRGFLIQRSAALSSHEWTHAWHTPKCNILTTPAAHTSVPRGRRNGPRYLAPVLVPMWLAVST